MSTPTSKLLEKVLDYSSVKQKVISKNIANLGTVGYQRQDVKFNKVFNESINSTLKATNSRHISSNKVNMNNGSEFEITKDENLENSSGINNVNIDQEMADMAKNTLTFRFAARKLRGYYTTMQTVIKGGR